MEVYKQMPIFITEAFFSFLLQNISDKKVKIIIW